MKKIVFLLLTFLSINLFAQSDTFKVKEGSFHHVQGCVTIPARYDINDLPMAVIKIIPENINEQDRTKLFFIFAFHVTLRKSIWKITSWIL